MRKRRALATAVAVLAVAAAACNGQPDPDFGDDGSVETGVLLWDRTFDVAVQPDGKILAVGASSDTWDGSTGREFSAVRLDPDGTLDTSFGGDGKITVDFPQHPSEQATSVVVLPSGKIVLGGHQYGNGCQDGWLFAALNPDGTLDTSQGNQQPVRNGTAVWQGNVFDPDIRLAGLTEMVVDGVRVDDIPGESDCQTVFDVAVPSSAGMLIAAKSHIYDGSLNSLVHFPGPAFFVTVDAQPDGKILASGTYLNAIDPTFRARFLPDGTPDTTFLGTFGPLENAGYQTGAAQDFHVQSDGKIVVSDGDLRRLDPNGTRDTAFGENGVVAVPGGDAFFGGGFAVQPDGKYVAVGDEAAGLDVDYWIGRFTP